MEKLYIVFILFILVVAGINLFAKALKKDIRILEQNRCLEKCKIFYTSHGKLFVKNHIEGVECTNEYGQKVIIDGFKIETITENLAQSIILTSFI